MYYRYLLRRGSVTTGLFHPAAEWGVPKKHGLYDIVPRYFQTLPYHKPFEGKSESWFKEEGVRRYRSGIEALSEFYKKYGITVIREETETLSGVIGEDDCQIWCEK